MEDARKMIVFDGIKSTRPLVRLIECQVEKWMERTNLGEIHTGNFEYKVEVGKEVNTSTFYCSLYVKIGQKRWRSHECGRTLQDALLRGLKHLHSYGPFAVSTKAQSNQVPKLQLMPT